MEDKEPKRSTKDLKPMSTIEQNEQSKGKFNI